MKISRMLLSAVSAFSIIAAGHGAAGATDANLNQHDSEVNLLPAHHPVGPGAIITRVHVDRSTKLQDPTLATFLVDYPPGASVVLQRMPSSGYVLVHVLSGTIQACAWHANIGTYRAGETWVEPAFASSIAAKNPSADESARTLVVFVTGSQNPDNANGITLGE